MLFGSQSLRPGPPPAGVLPHVYDPKTTLAFGWSSKSAFADKQAALEAFLSVLSKASPLLPPS